MTITNLTQKLAITGISLIILTTAGKAEAAVFNGGFETGDFTSWDTIGKTTIQTSALGSGPTEGNYQALVLNSPSFFSTTNSPSVPDSEIETFLNLTPGTLDALSSPNEATEGSAIKQTFTAQAGDIVSFDWNFLTFDETPNSTNNDFAFVSLNSTEVLADTFFNFIDSQTPFRDETGFNKFSFKITASGNYTLGVGVLDVGDTDNDSGLLIDNVSVEANSVPEPASLLGLLAVGTLSATALKRKKSS
ncbi:conserved exported hypothetical protein [Hyella patelloides LEGE 07179]|uniref:Ice-binding protein C-terminal domain-containing protein n=1 Tax=Hyella patelloides LEGE 07179 TaxID=945734 RepID=A0A563VPE3_9CYAN|nr:PEP-CTERM sorting domain-containing protein [Hyella patelloides]VEP13326.1 conserved exported hypothetical protein [Hyella patelloides LEGE 07179]